MRGKRIAPQPGEQPIIGFANAGAFRRWLVRRHATHPGIWMKITKKSSGLRSITCAEALDEALCIGWIDGQKKSLDAAFLFWSDHSKSEGEMHLRQIKGL